MPTLDFKCVFFARPSIARGDIKKIGTPIYMRIKYKGKQKVVATGINGPLEKWAKHLQRFNCDSRFARKANKQLDDMIRFIEDRYWRMEKAREENDFDTQQKMNKYLKGIAKLAEIEKPLTTHIGRHVSSPKTSTVYREEVILKP